MNPLDELYDMLEDQVLHIQAQQHHYTLELGTNPYGDTNPWTRDNTIIVTEDGIPTEHPDVQYALVDIITRIGAFISKGN